MESSVSTRRKRRKKIVHQCPNPLFEKWLKEWKEEAEAKGWKTQYTYTRALRSLQRYPLPLRSGKEARILDHFGDKLCQMLDDKLTDQTNISCTQQAKIIGPATGALPSNKYTGIISKNTENNVHPACTQEPTKKRRKTQPKKYIPAPRTGGHALLTSLLKFEIDKNEMSVQKNILISSAQPLCGKSFVTPEPGSYYTAWSSMGCLIKKGLVIKSGYPAKYSLTDLGRELAITLLETDQAYATEVDSCERNAMPQCSSDTNSVKFVAESIAPIILEDNYVGSSEKDELNDRNCHVTNSISEIAVLDSNDTESVLSSASNSTFEPIVFIPGTFEVVLCVDNCEVCTSRNSNQAVLSELQNLGVKYDIRKLHVGDFLWIARKCIESGVGDGNEIVLDYIVERKRMDDLAHSIKDGRFREQKFRLRKCGIKKPIYLIEEYGSNQCHGIPEASLNQAIVNIQIVDGFLVKRTKDAKASVRYLTMMTRYLQSLYSQKTLISCPENSGKPNDTNQFSFMLFNDFNSSAMKKKQLTIKEMFGKHLLQLKGLSVDKAVAIVEKYPTPSKLLQAYNMCESVAEKEKLLEDVKYGINQRRIGVVISKTLYRLYCLKQFSK